MEFPDISREDIIAPDGIMVVDRDEKIIVFNEAAQRISGFAEKDIIFQHYQLLFQASPSDGSYVAEALSEGASYANLSIDLNDAHGRKLSVLASITP